MPRTFRLLQPRSLLRPQPMPPPRHALLFPLPRSRTRQRNHRPNSSIDSSQDCSEAGSLLPLQARTPAVVAGIGSAGINKIESGRGCCTPQAGACSQRLENSRSVLECASPLSLSDEVPVALQLRASDIRSEFISLRLQEARLL